MKKNPVSMLLSFFVYVSAFIVIMTTLSIIGYVLIKGIPYLKPDLFAWNYTSENASLMPALINTILMTVLALVLAIPVGILAAVYLVEYAKRGNRLIGIIYITTEILAGLPSIVYGLFGFLLFAVSLHLGYSMIGGACTLAIMVLPLIMSTTEEALKAVPDAYREGSYGLGAGHARTVFQIVLPAAFPGILSGVILSIGRMVGETAALMYTAGTVAGISKNVLASGRTLSVHMYVLASEGFHINQAYATAVVLLVIVMAMNALSSLAASKLMKGQ